MSKQKKIILCVALVAFVAAVLVAALCFEGEASKHAVIVSPAPVIILLLVAFINKNNKK